MNKTLGLALSAVAMAVSLSAVTVSLNSSNDVKETFADDESYLYVDGEKVTSTNSSGAGWSFDYGANTLSLNNYSFEGDTPYITEHSCFANFFYYGTETFNVNMTGENYMGFTGGVGNAFLIKDSDVNFVLNGEMTMKNLSSYQNNAFSLWMGTHTMSFTGEGVYDLQMNRGFYIGGPTTFINLSIGEKPEIAIKADTCAMYGVASINLAKHSAMFTNWDDTEPSAVLRAGEDWPTDFQPTSAKKFVYPYQLPHTHEWSYAADGNKITATCSADGCDVTEGLTLTLNPPTRGIYYDGFSKYAELSQGYNKEAFGTPTIEYYKDGEKVDRCVKVGNYEARVTVGGATAKASFQVYPWYASPDEGPEDVILYFYEGETGVYMYLELTEKTADDLTLTIAQNQQIVKGYKVQLFVNFDGDVSEVTDLNDLSGTDGLDARAKVKIPESLLNRPFEIFHLSNGSAQTKIVEFTQENGYVTFPIETLGTIVFVGYIGSVTPGSEGGHGFCIGWLPLILNILIILVSAFYILVRLNVIKDLREKMEPIVSKEVLIVLIGALALLANFILDLVIMLVHLCPVSIIAFVLGALLLGGMLFWHIRTRLKGEMTPFEEKVYGKVFKKKQEDK